MINGLLDLSIWEMVGATLILTHLTIISVTVFLHRHQAHRALELHPLPSHLFRFWLWLSTGMRTKEWVAIHRKHHVKCETEEDPHSPQVLGIKKVLWQGAELYREAAEVTETLDKYGKGTPDDWLERNVYRHSFAGIGLMLLADVLMFGVAGVTVWAVQMLWIPFWAAGVINGIGHYWGYRNYECPDAATNIVPWGILIGGEELHNNHHTYPNSARLSSKRWEFDIGWLYIRVLEMLGLARVKKVARLPQLGQPKSALDMDSVRAVLSNRFQVMARYSRDVIVPVCRMEAQRSCANSRACAWLKRARKALVRNEALLDSRDRQALSQALENSEQLQVVYSFKQRLQKIWERSGTHSATPLADLQEWCRQAEATGVAMLGEFAGRLHRYTLENAAAR
ncbi:aminotransferase [Candidatus Tenderia electrophaga]|jgi:stearoyl-CoA desaturase (delta-9 desaturase)|uniref:Aminotransferase n=1 Tax=Candidatus Tenderia electrophaga TaxID=1748243 RepID=A0A0S2TDQ8_9GAMM|nr:aminotransferase [Candidatus Tenderia electrophaga]